ncbi:MAG TPA: M23 family metallopeptidase [Syntrophorhabdales bacterium]|nr:M23 family metallopeptidase [Syntrophorhabdales bacterium]
MRKVFLFATMWFLVLVLGASVSPACDSSSLELTLLDAVFVRSTGTPVTVSKTFPSVKGQMTVYLTTGSSTHTELDQSSISTIMVDGFALFDSGDFDQHVWTMKKILTVLSGPNELTVTMKGKPGSQVRIQIVQQIDADAAAVVGPSGGRVTTASRPGAEVVIPQGALSDLAIITIKATGEDGVTGHVYDFYSTVQPFLKPVAVALSYAPFTLPSNIEERDLTFYTGYTAANLLKPDSIDLKHHTITLKTTQFSTLAIGAYQGTGVTINQLSPAAALRMPIGDGRTLKTLGSCGARASTQDLGADLSLLRIGAYSNGYPKITFNSAAGNNRWIVGTAFDRKEYLTDYTKGTLASSSAYNPGEDWYMLGKDAMGSPVHAIADGIVVFNQRQWAESSKNSDKSVGFGNITIIAHELASGDIVASVYGHLKAVSPCALGSSVKEGDVIGLIDDDAPSCTSDHLHFELAKGYQPKTDNQKAVEYLFRIDPGTGEIKVPVRVLKQGREAVREDGWYWPGYDSDFIQKNYYNPSPFIKSYDPYTPPPAVTPPVVAMSPNSGVPGTIMTESGTGCTPSGVVILHYKKPDGTELPVLSVTADGAGNFGTTYTLPADQPAGIYTWWAVDSTTALKSNEVSFEIQSVVVVPDAQIFYDLVNLGSGMWQYTYTIQNNKVVDSFGGLSWFTTFFPADTDASGNLLYSNLAGAGSLPYNWRAQIMQPSLDPSRSYEPRGMYGCSSDATTTYNSSGVPNVLETPLLPGNILNGFTVTFTYTGSGTPGPQQFRIADLNSGQIILSGMTQPRTP